MSKTLIIESQSAPIHYENEINVIYNSYNREINITDVVNHAIMTCKYNYMKYLANRQNFRFKSLIIRKESIKYLEIIQVQSPYY